MTDLRKLARGQDCQVRIPAVCNFNPETTVLAHLRRANVAGAGQKPPDSCAVWACSACHDAIDRRAHTHIPLSELAEFILDALIRMLAIYHRRGIKV